jgi:hypothetical protein
MKKYRILYALLLIVPGITGKSQKIINKTIDWEPGQNVEINIGIIDSIKIVAWDQDKVQASLSVNIDNNKHNDWYDLITETSNNSVKLEGSFSKNKTLKNLNVVNAEINGTIYIPKECYLSVETINGNVEVKGHQGSLNVNTISGFIDVSLSSKRSASLTINSISGKVFTDLDLTNEKQTNSFIGTNIKAKINNGQTPINLKTISGNIYLREDI